MFFTDTSHNKILNEKMLMRSMGIITIHQHKWSYSCDNKYPIVLQSSLKANY